MRKVIKNWKEIFEQHRQSGKSIPEFCNDIGIHPNTFYKHRKRFSGDAIAVDSAVVEIKPEISAKTEPIVIQTKKFMISISEGFDETHLKSVLKVIGEL
ncbi:MAG: hypothetical protein PQJ46_01410 [Spirochaetales bacterium]|nr:hypothetical protein [Spirochaetales bacterium]